MVKSSFILVILGFILASYFFLVWNHVKIAQTVRETRTHWGDPASSSIISKDVVVTQKTSSFYPSYRHWFADDLFPNLLQSLPDITSKHIVIEVGCHRLKQSAFAAGLGYKVLSYEASPANYKVMMDALHKSPQNIQDRLQVFNNAVSEVSGATLLFDAIGGTGDHVSGMNLDAAQKTKYDVRKNSKVEVTSVSLDDTIDKLAPDESVFLLKVDVQGHEAHVFKGMEKSLKAGKIKYIMFEYWVDALDDASGKPNGSCSAVDSILIPLVEAGYALFDMKVLWHPNAKTKGVKVAHNYAYNRPLDFRENCQWFVQRGRETKDYDMGYWTDVVAVYGGV